MGNEYQFAKQTKVVVFRNGGIIKKTEKWCYKGKFLNIVSNYK